LSLKDIGELSDFITGIRGIDKNLDFTSKAQSIASLLDGVDDLDIVNKIFKNSGVTKDLAEEALKYTAFSKSLDKVAKSSIEGAEQITNLEKATKGLKKTNAITDVIDTADDLSDILDSSTDIIGEKLKDIKNGFKGLATSIAAHPIITGTTAITAAGVAAYSIYKNYKKNMMETATASSHQGFQVCPQLLHLLTVLLLPKNPVQNEYPFCPAVIEVDPHFGQRGLDSSAFLRSASAS